METNNTLPHDSRLVMIVRSNSPRNNGMRGEGLLGDVQTLNFNMGMMEAEWRQQQFQRQRMQLLSMAIFLCFMVLFFDNTATERREQQRSRGINPFAHYYNENNQNEQGKGEMNETERQQSLQQFRTALSQDFFYQKDASPLNVSGIYAGDWHLITNEQYLEKKPNYTDIIPFLKIDRTIFPQEYTQKVHRGQTWFFLKKKTPAIKEIQDEVSYVTGQVVIYDKESSLMATILPVQGVFLRKIGRLTLFGNSPDSSVQLLYRKKKAHDINDKKENLHPIIPSSSSSTFVTSNNRTNVQRKHGLYGGIFSIGIDHGKNYDDDYGAIDISPPRYIGGSSTSRFRSTDSFNDQCVSILEFQLSSSSSSNKNEQLRLNGTLGSENCGFYLQLNGVLKEENLDRFFLKAFHYGLLMILMGLVEIFFIVKQLQISNTQATASKISLLTIGQQAILDSYLCLGHLSIGIVAQNVFTTFAIVAFIKLIIFSVFEMRYLLIIWKARRPQGFSEGWLVLRRELTTLYSRFYLSLLLGLCTIYNFWNQLPLLVFFCYSFWVPQIVHNAHREVRNPFDPLYLYGISAIRMFLPLYFYGCPENFLSAFPMYASKPRIGFCYGLIFWMSLQVGILYLQQRYGPRFFVPARFLPVKYNYERRIDIQELSLVRSSNEDTIDCVICMVELDIAARDYMIAPCDHIFHRECLLGWMKVKMECPTCRYVLPEP